VGFPLDGSVLVSDDENDAPPVGFLTNKTTNASNIATIAQSQMIERLIFMAI
jgi:hypothetical protein